MEHTSVYKPTELYEPAPKSVREYGYYDDMNVYSRGEMEDGYIIEDLLIDEPTFKVGLFAVLDGHGGTKVRDQLKEHLPKELKAQLLNSRATGSGGSIPDLLRTTFLNVNETIRRLPDIEDGSTACVALVVREFPKNTMSPSQMSEEKNCKIFLANVGDTRAILISEGDMCRRLTKDHKASDPEEQARIQKAGGNIFRNRVEGSLAITRAFGDFELSSSGVTAEPDVQDFPVSQQNRYCLLYTSPSPRDQA
eukprot:TRINITY_DN5618_c0_g1_i4.p1 TRINITY_DN5618_c0_g1~~TRINITY_DN5618_c0_g1_i4.p1  ORF type:complete len:251 (-),score=34.70 TRINITY_DN5618_c0_g1_i4:35-787(-)